MATKDCLEGIVPADDFDEIDGVFVHIRNLPDGATPHTDLGDPWEPNIPGRGGATLNGVLIEHVAHTTDKFALGAGLDRLGELVKGK